VLQFVLQCVALRHSGVAMRRSVSCSVLQCDAA